MHQEEQDKKWMMRAIANARLSEGLTRPNPPVGAVIVRDGVMLGEGRHHRAGMEHAEVNAIAACSTNPRGACAYVTLEPCSTFGRQPPCTAALLNAGISRVVVSCLDVNPKHAGRGLEILRNNGVEVVENVCRAEGEELLKGFNKHITTALPYLTVKLGMTLDGCIADSNGASQWITGEESRSQVQELRRKSDAVLVGGATAQNDDPSLLYRTTFPGEPLAGSKLLRVVLDLHNSLNPALQVFTDNAAPRTILVRRQSLAPVTPVPAGVECWQFADNPDGTFPYRQLMERLAKEKDCLRVLCEGGGRTAMALTENGLVDEYQLFIAPAILGDAGASRAFSGSKRLLIDKLKLRFTSVTRFGDDILISALPQNADNKKEFQ